MTGTLLLTELFDGSLTLDELSVLILLSGMDELLSALLVKLFSELDETASVSDVLLD